MVLRTLMFLCVFYTGHLSAQTIQPTVAIKDPIIGDGVSKNLAKLLDINQSRAEMEASFRATRKFRVLSRDKKTLKAILDEQNFAQSDLAKGDAVSKGLLSINAQMLDSSSGQIVTTFFLKSTFATKTRIVNSRSGRPSSVYFTKMAKNVAAKLASQFVAQVYPMKVIKRMGNGQVIINRGQDGGLKKGTVLAVFSAGEELIYPDTGGGKSTREPRLLL